MRKIIMALAILSLTACATPPQWLANMYDRNDACQNYYKQPNYQYPSWCGSSQGKTYITRDYYSNRILTSTKAQ